MSAFFSPIEPAGQDISTASHVPLPWQSGEPRADTGAKGSHVAANATWKNPLSMQPPRLRAAFCHVQSTITGLLTYSHNTSPSLAAARFGRHCSLIHTIQAPQQRSAVCRRHPLIHTIPAPHQRLPRTEDSALSLIQGDMGPSRCKESPHPPRRKVARGHWCPCVRKWWLESWHPCAEKSAKAPSRFCWTITPVVYAPTKCCSTRSYSIVSL